MSELSDVGRLGARQARRSTSRARSDAPKRSEGAGDAAMRRDSPADDAGEPERGAGASEEGRDGLASVLEKCQARSRSGPQPSGTILDEADSAGLRPDAILVYGERS